MMANGGGDQRQQSLAALTGESLVESVEKDVRSLLSTVAGFEQQVQRFTATTEVMKRGNVEISTRLPSHLIGLFSVGEALVAAFDCPDTETPEVADLLRIYRPEGRELRLAPNSLAHHKALSRWIRDLYLSYKGRVQFVEVLEEEGCVLLAFEVHHGANRPPRRHLLGLQFEGGVDALKLVRNPMPAEALTPDFTGFKELSDGTWHAGERTNAYYNHAQAGPVFAFLEWGELKLRDYLARPRGDADFVVPGAADPEHSVVPFLTEFLPGPEGRDDALVRVQPEEGADFQYVHYQKQPKAFHQLDPKSIPGTKLPSRLGKITSMCLWTGGELVYLGGLPAQPISGIEAPSGGDFLYVFQGETGRFTVHHFVSTSRKVVHSFHDLGAFTLNRAGCLYLFKAHDQGPTQEHQLSSWVTPFRTDENGLSAAQQAYLMSFSAQEVEGLGDALRALSVPIKAHQFRNAREQLDRALVQWPFVERVKDVRSHIQALHESLDHCLAVESELQQIFEQRLESLSDFRDDVDECLEGLKPKPSQGMKGVLEGVGAVRTLQGRLEQLLAQPHIPGDAVSAYEGLKQRLKSSLGKLSAQGARRCAKVLKDTAAFVEESSQGIEAVSSLMEIERLLLKVQSLRQDLVESVDSLKLLNLDAIESLDIAQQGTAGVVSCDRLERALKDRRKGLSQNERRGSFQTYAIQLDLQIATEPGNINQVDEVSGSLDALLASIEAKKSDYADYADLIAELTERQEQARRRYEARKLRLTQIRTQAVRELGGQFELHLGALEMAARSTKMAPDALEGFLVSHPETLACQRLLERLKSHGLEGQAAGLKGQLDRKRRQLVIERHEREIFAIEGEALFLGGIRFHRNRLSLAVQETFDEQGFALTVSGTDLQLRGEHLGALVPPDAYVGHVNECDEVSRAEFLAYRVLSNSTDLAALAALARRNKDEAIEALQEPCRELALSLRDEEHTLGLHDRDAAVILRKLVPLWHRLGPLRWPSDVRVLAARAWAQVLSPESVISQGKALASLGKVFQSQRGVRSVFIKALEHVETPVTGSMLDYLEAELHLGGLESTGGMVVHPTALKLANRIAELNGERTFKAALLTLEDAETRFAFLIPEISWLIDNEEASLGFDASEMEPLKLEVAWLLATGRYSACEGDVKTINTTLTLRGLSSEHSRADGPLTLDVPTWYARLTDFELKEVPAFRAFRSELAQTRRELTERLELSTLMPKPLAGFAWTRLLRRVYLPMIAKAFQKQLGSLDEPGLDQMGVLLLVSPPGYGKTEILKKVAQLLGYAFVSISGTALGKDTHALDPASAPDKASAAALKRLIRGLQFKENVILDIEDVQACSPAFLEKLLPLCDATRTLEIPQTDGQIQRIDLQRRRVAVVMTLNPLGATIPQALANRASLINLGDVAERHGADFALSYLEVAAPSNRTLELASTQNDLETFALALGEGRDFSTLEADLNGRYAGSELKRIHQVLEHVVAIRDVLLKVNEACLHSATVEDIYRVKPAFELQGSYRDMIEISRQVEPDWTSERRLQAILTHYEGQAGLLGSQGESNLLSLRAMLEPLDEEESSRLAHIRRIFRLNQEREQTLLALLDRLTEVTEAVQAVPQAIAQQGISLDGQLESLSSALVTLPFDMTELARRQNAVLFQGLAAQVLEVGEKIGHLAKAVEAGSHLTNDTLQVLAQQAVAALWGSSEGISLSAARRVVSTLGRESEEHEVEPQLPGQDPSVSKSVASESTDVLGQSAPIMAEQQPLVQEGPGEAVLHNLEEIEALATEDPEAFLARFLNPEVVEATPSESASPAEGQDVALELAPMEEPEKTEQPERLVEEPTLAEAPGELPLASSGPSGPTIPPSNLGPLILDSGSTEPKLGGFAALLQQALSAATMEVTLRHGSEPAWALQLQKTLCGIKDDLKVISEAAAKPKEKSNILLDLKKVLSSLPE